MARPSFILIVMPNGDRMLRNVADIRYVRVTETATGELAVLAKLFGEGPDAREKMLCVGPESKDYFNWLVRHPCIDVLNVWEDTGESTELEVGDLGDDTSTGG